METIEKRQGLKIACVEEVAYGMGYIDSERLEELAWPMRNNGYGKYLMNTVKYDVFGSLTVQDGL